MNVHLLTIGDEILIGQITDTNSAWMGRVLNLRGMRVVSKSSVGDTREAIIQGVEHAARDADAVIITGGLGPTKDDITKKTLADMFGSPMSLHQETLDRISAYFQKIGRPLPPAMTQQATLPDAALVLTNKVGTAPGMWFERGDKVYISLPGVPFEMEYLMTHEVLPRLSERFQSRPIVHRTLLTAGEGESNIAKRIEPFEENLPAHVKLAYLPALGQVRLRLTGLWPGPVTPDAQGILELELEGLKNKLAALLPDILYGYEEDSLEAAVGRLLLEKSLTFGTAESCTGGYIAHLITRIPGASRYFNGSVVSYSNTLKRQLLDVPADILETHGAVSEATASAMATGALRTLGTDVALSVTGIAGPDGGTAEKPVGTVWAAIADRDRVETVRFLFGRDREKNIQMTATYALHLLYKFLVSTAPKRN